MITLFCLLFFLISANAQAASTEEEPIDRNALLSLYRKILLSDKAMSNAQSFSVLTKEQQAQIPSYAKPPKQTQTRPDASINSEEYTRWCLLQSIEDVPLDQHSRLPFIVSDVGEPPLEEIVKTFETLVRSKVVLSPKDVLFAGFSATLDSFVDGILTELSTTCSVNSTITPDEVRALVVLLKNEAPKHEQSNVEPFIDLFCNMVHWHMYNLHIIDNDKYANNTSNPNVSDEDKDTLWQKFLDKEYVVVERKPDFENRWIGPQIGDFTHDGQKDSVKPVQFQDGVDSVYFAWDSPIVLNKIGAYLLKHIAQKLYPQPHTQSILFDPSNTCVLCTYANSKPSILINLNSCTPPYSKTYNNTDAWLSEQSQILCQCQENWADQQTLIMRGIEFIQNETPSRSQNRTLYAFLYSLGAHTIEGFSPSITLDNPAEEAIEETPDSTTFDLKTHANLLLQNPKNLEHRALQSHPISFVPRTIKSLAISADNASHTFAEKVRKGVYLRKDNHAQFILFNTKFELINTLIQTAEATLSGAYNTQLTLRELHTLMLFLHNKAPSKDITFQDTLLNKTKTELSNSINFFNEIMSWHYHDMHIKQDVAWSESFKQAAQRFFLQAFQNKERITCYAQRIAGSEGILAPESEERTAPLPDDGVTGGLHKDIEHIAFVWDSPYLLTKIATTLLQKISTTYYPKPHTFSITPYYDKKLIVCNFMRQESIALQITSKANAQAQSTEAAPTIWSEDLVLRSMQFIQQSIPEYDSPAVLYSFLHSLGANLLSGFRENKTS